MNCIINWCRNFPALSNKQRAGVILVFLLLLVGSLTAQEIDPVTWEATLESEGDEQALIMKASIEDGWYLYSQFIGEDGPIPTSFAIGTADEENEQTKYSFIETKESSDYTINTFDEMFQMELTKYKKSASFRYEIMENLDDQTIYIMVEYMCCDDMQCLPPVTKELIINNK